MEAIRKQATKLRDQVAKQQQAVFRQFTGVYGSDNVIADETELQHHQRLEKLYISTRAGKHFQRDIVRGVEGYIVHGSKQVEIGTKLSEDCRKYAMVMGAPLEDARQLAQRYDRVRQEAEAQGIDVSRRQARVRDSMGNPDIVMKLEAAEAKLLELKTNTATLGKEATAAMAAVEGQQQKMTLQRLVAMVESERTYHQRVLQILDQLEGELLSERQRIEASPSVSVDTSVPPPPPYEEINGSFASQTYDETADTIDYFLGEVVHPFRGVSDVELSLSAGDYVVVRKVSNSGWAEGECKGKAGWFPLDYVERRERVLASKMAHVF
ncbi:hypothetical protein EUGRSUZ_F01618 [Eucalyptus grandis]|uniref:Uncharacterized protein n=2 Tax=Eucalyptus grandis TaxID=71139 RepID=A0ACC3KFU0_EUCGR|nr:hypothetical protein EUGRSUZ_F01618 [Eucalyptus grandis]